MSAQAQNWMQIVQQYNKPNNFLSWWQIINTVIPYIGLWILMVYSLSISYWLTLALAIPAAGFLVRIFIIFHDLGHGSFFKSKKLSEVLGIIMGLFVFTPYHRWHHDHQVHHQTVGNLDKRGVGDVNTLTVEEYQHLSKFRKFTYRLYRHPATLFVFAPLVLFTLLFRIPKKRHSKIINRYTHLTTLLLIAIVIGISLLIGFKTFLIIQIPVLYIAAAHGNWLFYLQHQYKDVEWKRQKEWNYKDIALKGSSYLKLPKVIQWFTGNIGFHHIHHLGPKIPNYKLEKAYKENALFHVNKPLKFFTALDSLKYRLWDEQRKKLVSFKGL